MAYLTAASVETVSYIRKGQPGYSQYCESNSDCIDCSDEENIFALRLHSRVTHVFLCVCCWPRSHIATSQIFVYMSLLFVVHVTGFCVNMNFLSAIFLFILQIKQ